MTTFFWTKYPFVRVGLAFVMGIFLAYLLLPLPDFMLTKIQIHMLYLSIIGLCIVSLFLFFKKKFTKSVFLLFVFFCIGLIRFTVEDPRYNSDHIYHHDENTIQAVQGQITTEPQLKNDKLNFTLSVDYIYKNKHWTKTQGLLKIYKKGNAKYSLGETLIINGKLNKIEPIETAYDFNYGQYLAYQKIHITMYASDIKQSLNRAHPNLLFYIKNKTILSRNYIESIIKKHIVEKQHQAILIGLLTGTRSSISKEDKALFTNNGTIHILAISGMHIVLLYQVVLFFISFCKIKKGNIVVNLFLLGFIWFYISICGLQASTVRAGIMISVLLIGLLLRKKPQHINSLFATAFIMLLYNPYYISDIGFCLSFLAIIGILLVSEIDFPEHVFKKYILQASAISIGTQLTTLPYAVFLFQQFPVYFLLANLIVVPLSTVMLIGSLALVMCNQIPYLSHILSYSLSHMCDFLFYTLHVLNQLPLHLLTRLYLNQVEVFILYLLLLSITMSFFTKRKQWLWTTCSLCILLSFSFHFKIIEAYNSHTMLISGMNKNRQYTIVHKTIAYELKNPTAPKNTYATEKFLNQHLVQKTVEIPLPQQANFYIRLGHHDIILICRKPDNSSNCNAKKTSLCIIDYKNKNSYITPTDEHYNAPKNRYIFSNGKANKHIKELEL